MDYKKFAEFNEIAILFSPPFKNLVKDIYDDLGSLYPTKEIYLVSCPEIICAAKYNKFECYLLLGIECPLHKFQNSLQYKINPSEKVKQKIDQFSGATFIDSIYNISIDKGNSTDKEILVATENQQVLNYYCQIYENVQTTSSNLEIKNRVQFLMKENSSGSKMHNKKLIGVIFTSKLFENIADAIVTKINDFSRAYKVFLKDISYERLISIDNLDCMILVDCPLFECNLKLHIPVLTPFSVNSFFNDQWNDVYNKNQFSSESKELIVRSHASDLMVQREYQGVLFTNDNEDMDIHQGKRGIASEYENEGSHN